jgi:transcriptional regulator with XRE-family HTH domain
MEIGSRIKEYRVQGKLNMKRLADRVKCTASLISQLERGKVGPSISTLKKIAKALNVNIVDFFMSTHNEDDVVTRVSERVDMQLRRWDGRSSRSCKVSATGECRLSTR